MAIFKTLNQLMSGGATGLLDVNIPSFDFVNGYVSKNKVSSIGEAVGSVVDSVQNLMQLTQITWCILANPGAFFGGGVNLLLGGVLGIAGDIANRLAGLIRGQITQALGQITGAVSNLVGSIFSFLNGIVGILDAITDLIKKIEDINASQFEFFIDEEECSYVFAAIAACLLNKLLGPKLTVLENKISKKIIEVGSDLNESIADVVNEPNVVSSYIQREAFFMNKAERQIRGLSNFIP